MTKRDTDGEMPARVARVISAISSTSTTTLTARDARKATYTLRRNCVGGYAIIVHERRGPRYEYYATYTLGAKRLAALIGLVLKNGGRVDNFVDASNYLVT